MKKIIEDIREFVHSQWMLGALHGVRHWDRVYENGQKLLTPDVNPLVLGLFAYLHDSCRMDDGEDLYHGERAALWIGTLRNTYLKDVSDEEIELLKEACRLHTTELKTGNHRQAGKILSQSSAVCSVKIKKGSAEPCPKLKSNLRHHDVTTIYE